MITVKSALARLTDRTWRALGIASECLGWRRADLLENLVEYNQGNFPYYPFSEEVSPETDFITPEKPINQDNLEVLAEKVVRELRYGKQSSHYKVAKKALKRNCSITTGGDRRRRSMGLLKNCASALIAE